MTQFTVPTRGEVSANNQAIFDNLKKSLRMIPNLYAAIAYSDTALETYLHFQNAKTSLSKKEKEAVNLIVSQVNGCRYCQSAHTMLGKMNGFTDEEIIDIRHGFLSSNNKIDALVKLTKAITETKGKIDDAVLKHFFDAGYTKASLVDVVMAIADKVVMNYIHNITQVPIDFPEAVDIENIAVV